MWHIWDYLSPSDPHHVTSFHHHSDGTNGPSEHHSTSSFAPKTSTDDDSAAGGAASKAPVIFLVPTRGVSSCGSSGDDGKMVQLNSLFGVGQPTLLSIDFLRSLLSESRVTRASFL